MRWTVPLLWCISRGIWVHCIYGAESPVLPGFCKGTLKKKDNFHLGTSGCVFGPKMLATVLKACRGFSDGPLMDFFWLNHEKDVLQMVAGLESLIGLILVFQYVLTTENPADLITRSLTMEKFKACIRFWCHGPDWLHSGITPWATQELPCLNQHSQQISCPSLNALVI